MSDGRTEAMRGTYFSNKKSIPTHDPQTGDLNPHYEELTGKPNPLKIITTMQEPKPSKNIESMPDQYLHRIISFFKSIVRIIGYGIIPFDLVVATIILIISEVIGIVEELV
jgi:hypothetical protein